MTIDITPLAVLSVAWLALLLYLTARPLSGHWAERAVWAFLAAVVIVNVGDVT